MAADRLHAEQLGGDAVEAIKMCLDDFGNAAGGFKLEYEALDDGVAANNGGPDAAKETDNVNKVMADADAIVYMGDLQLRRGQDLDSDHERRRAWR